MFLALIFLSVIRRAGSAFNQAAIALPFNTIQKPELLEDTNSITRLHISRPSLFPLLAFASPETSSAGSPHRVPAFCCSGEEIHHPGGEWQLRGRWGTLPVGAALRQLGVLLEQRFTRQTRCSCLYLILFCFCSSCLCCLADKLFLGVSGQGQGQELGFGQDGGSVSWRGGERCWPQGFCQAQMVLPLKSRVLKEVSSAAWACFVKAVVKPFPSSVMKGFTVCCKEPLKS